MSFHALMIYGLVIGSVLVPAFAMFFIETVDDIIARRTQQREEVSNGRDHD